MTEEIIPPFSARNRGAHAQIDDDCPESARIGLLHLLRRLVDKEYVGGWRPIREELQRIARVPPNDDDSLDALLLNLPWDKVYDFCQRLYGHLAQELERFDDEAHELAVVTSRGEVQEYIAAELRLLFLEEDLAFEFSNGLVRRRGRRHTADQVARAELVLGDQRFITARTHYNKALRYFRNVAQPDYENVVKEAVCAVEAMARTLFPSEGSTLGEIVKSITGSEPGQLPKSIAQTFHGLYGFRGGGEGVGHGGATGGPVTKELAEYALAVTASQMVLLVNLASISEADVPF